MWDSKITSASSWYRIPNGNSSELWFIRQDGNPSLGSVPDVSSPELNYIYTDLPASTLVHFDIDKSILMGSLREKYKSDKSATDSLLVTKISKGFVFFNFLVSDSEECGKLESEKIQLENKNAVEFKLPINVFFDKNGFSKLGYIEGNVPDCKKFLSQSMISK